MWKTAARRLRLRPIRPPALIRPAGASSSSGWPPASARLGQLAALFWLADHTGPCFPTQVAAAGGVGAAGLAVAALAAVRANSVL
eukprot:scaffold125369_cov42-Phaeocystis_antarctica.AAC.1